MEMHKKDCKDGDTQLMTTQERTEVKEIDKCLPASNMKLDDHDDDGNIEDKNKRDEKPLYDPPDGGWGWCVVFAATVCTMVLATQGPCFGIFYGDRLRELGASPTLAAWLFNFQSLTWNLAGPWAGFLSKKFSYRLVAMTSSFLACSSLMISSLVNNPYHLLFTFSLFSGIGGGICINCCFHMIAKYFKNRLGLATGLMVTGGSVGLFVMPQMASYLQRMYPFEWAAVIAGALMMNAVAAAALFHPIEWHVKKSNLQSRNTNIYSPAADQKDEEEKQQLQLNPLDPTESRMEMTPSKFPSHELPRCSSVPQNLFIEEIKTPQARIGTPTWRKRTVSEAQYFPRITHENDDVTIRGFDASDNRKLSVFQFGSCTLTGSALTISESQRNPSNEKCLQNSSMDDHSPDEHKQGFWKALVTHYNPSVVLRDPLVVSMALCTCITITSALNIFSAIPFILNDGGYDLQSAASAISISAIADLVTRISCAAINDRSWVNPRLLYASGQVIIIVAPIVLITNVHHWPVVLTCMVAMGIGLGILYTLDVFIIVRVLGVDQLQSVFGMSQLFRVITFATLGPIGGVLRDKTGTYVSCILFYTCNVFLGIILIIFTGIYTQCKPRSRVNT